MEEQKKVYFTEDEIIAIYAHTLQGREDLKDLNLSLAQDKLNKIMTDIFRISYEQGVDLNKINNR